jgi:leucyl aminopeptidase
MTSYYKQTRTKTTTPIHLIKRSDYAKWLKQQKSITQKWLKNSGFYAEVGAYSVLPNARGEIEQVVLIINHESQVGLLGELPRKLPRKDYYIVSDLPEERLEQACIAWGMGAYVFSRYKAHSAPAKLVLPKAVNKKFVHHMVAAFELGRDLISTPAEDLSPLDLAEAAIELVKVHGGKHKLIKGKALAKDYPAIHMVGRAGSREACLIDFQWGDKSHPSLTLVGKGICFDTGGLDLKPAAAMILMKKDMGGAAHVLALASLIMSEKLPINLRVLIPAADNAIDGEAFRPSDVITMRNGSTVEIKNTDAEGRLVLADALTDAVEAKPDLLIDFATLTGAARVALGPEYAVMFTEASDVANSIFEAGHALRDPVWQLPLHRSYRRELRSKIADMTNCSLSLYGGAITAALFLEAFVDPKIDWIHFDVMAWNLYSRPGHPVGADLMGVRAVFDYLKREFAHGS